MTTTATTPRRSPSALAFRLVVVSLFSTNTTAVLGFVQSNSLRRQNGPQHQQVLSPQKSPPSSEPLSNNPFSSLISNNRNNNRAVKLSSTDIQNNQDSNDRPTKTKTKKYKLPTLSREEETDLLRQVFEYRRITKLEQDLALSPKYRPGGPNPLLLSVKSREAGYGDEFDLYEQAKYDGQKARETLVTHNMGLVHHCVNQIIGKDTTPSSSTSRRTTTTTKQYKKLPLNSLSREDLVQEGAIGLARAVDKWDPAIAVDGKRGGGGNKFSTYAYYWIRAAILRCIAERDDMMRVPSHVSQAVREINKAASRLGLELDGSGNSVVSTTSLSWKEANAAKKLAEEAGLTDQNFQVAMKVRNRRYGGGYVPFEQWMQNGLNLQTDVADMMTTAAATTGSSSSMAFGSDNGNAEQVRSVLSKFLRPKEMEALSWRYGLLRDDDIVNADESPAERANRQFAQMEDELFGGTEAPATTTVLSTTKTAAPVAAAAVTTAKVLNAPTGKSGEAMSFVDVGKRMKVSAEYTRRLCHRALDKLRSAADEGRLEPAFLM